MCVTFCHVRQFLYLNHYDCLPEMCKHALGPYEPCATCRYRQGALCGLTMAALPEGEQGCCHHNAELLSGEQVLADEIYIPLEDYYLRERGSFQMDTSGVPYSQKANGKIGVDPDDTILPATFGRGVDHE